MTRKWAAYSVDVLAEYDRWIAEHPEEASFRRPNAVFEVKVDEEQRYDDITNPASIDTRVSSRLMPKMALVYAEALVKAAEVVSAVNVRLHEKHDKEAGK